MNKIIYFILNENRDVFKYSNIGVEYYVKNR